MTGTLDRPKAKLHRVADDPRYRAVFDKLSNLRAQYSAAAAEFRRLDNEVRAHAGLDAVQARADAYLKGESVADAEGIKQQLQTARLNELALHRAIELQELELQNIHRLVASEIHAATKPELDAKLAAIMQAVNEVFDRIDDLGAHLNAMNDAGASLQPDQFGGVFVLREVAAYFQLPRPEVCGVTRERIVEHWHRHFPAAANKAGV